MANYYQILGLPNFASIQDVRKSFRRMAVQYHPDKHGGQKVYEEKFKSINLAYQTLGDASKKAIYDQRLLYGSTSTSSYSSTSKHTNKKAKGNHPPDKNQQHTYKKKHRKEYVYTDFQKKLIKACYILIPIFILTSILINLTYDKKRPSDALRQINSNLKLSINTKLSSNDFLSAEPYIDSLTYINQMDSDKDEYQNTLFKKQKERVNDFITQENHEKIITGVLILKRMKNKFSVYIPNKYNLHLANSYFEKDQPELALNEIRETKRSLSEYADLFFLSDIYLRNQYENNAFQITSENNKLILNFFKNRLGFRYYSILSNDTISVHPSITKEFLQHQVLTVRNDSFYYEKDEESLIDNYLKIQLGEKQKACYQYLKSKAFITDSCSHDSLKYYKEELNYFCLDKLYGLAY